MTSMCNLCRNQDECIRHIFFVCLYAHKIWSWLVNISNSHLVVSSFQDLWILIDSGPSSHAKLLLTSACVNIIVEIWRAKNNSGFNGLFLPWQACTVSILSNVSFLAGYSTMGLSLIFMIFSFSDPSKSVSNLPLLQKESLK